MMVDLIKMKQKIPAAFDAETKGQRTAEADTKVREAAGGEGSAMSEAELASWYSSPEFQLWCRDNFQPSADSDEIQRAQLAYVTLLVEGYRLH
jgi:hypothetical protein